MAKAILPAAEEGTSGNSPVGETLAYEVSIVTAFVASRTLNSPAPATATTSERPLPTAGSATLRSTTMPRGLPGR